jgi:penicillin-binding protein 2
MSANQLAYRKHIFIFVVATVVFIYLLRLFYIQLIDDTYRVTADNQAFRYVTDYPARGNIFDRNGKRLVYNQAAFDLMVVPRQVKQFDTLTFANLLNITKLDLVTRLKKARKESVYKSAVIEKGLSVEASASIQEQLYLYPGFYMQPRTLRKYPMSVAAHLLGYVGEVSPEIVDTSRYYRMGDYIGISGIEKSYEHELKGIRGTRIILVDVHNREQGSYMNGQFDTVAVAGNDMYTTLDLDLQVYAEQLLRNKTGSIVAIEPQTGEILAMASSPSYDPNLLVGNVRSKNYAALSRDSSNPLFNRAMMASYPPGSTFKISQALIAEQEGLLSAESRLPCSFSVAGKSIHCHPHPSPASLGQSIQYSCNPFYCRTFINIINKYKKTEEGYLNWKKHVNSMGFGVKLNVDLPSELRGNVPSVAFYDRYHGKGRWKAASIYSLGIGQGEMGVTPLQMANYACLLANKGYYIIPHVAKKLKSGAIEKRFSDKKYATIDARYFDVVHEAMYQVVEAGTARGGKMDSISICGKTGTAQNPHGEDHSIFICFAPKENPKIALAVYVENAGFGATWAVPIASLLIEQYLTGKVKRADLEKRMLEGKLTLSKKH